MFIKNLFPKIAFYQNQMHQKLLWMAKQYINSYLNYNKYYFIGIEVLECQPLLSIFIQSERMFQDMMR